MKNSCISADKVEKEIERLKQSEHVRLSQKEQRLKADRRRKMLADLRWHEKRGKQLEAAGVTWDNIRAFVEAASEEDET